MTRQWVLAQAVAIPISEVLAWISAGIILLFGTDLVHQGIELRHGAGGAAIQVADICTALESTLLLAGAILVYPARIKSRLYGLMFAVIAVQSLNVIRIVTLFYVAHFFPAQFDWIHVYAWGIVLMLDVALCFVAWVVYDNRYSTSSTPVSALS